jgi:hypothetical protein
MRWPWIGPPARESDTDLRDRGRPSNAQDLWISLGLARDGRTFPNWYMGSLNDDGSINCWSAYGDLYEALRGL